MDTHVSDELLVVMSLPEKMLNTYRWLKSITVTSIVAFNFWDVFTACFATTHGLVSVWLMP